MNTARNHYQIVYWKENPIVTTRIVLLVLVSAQVWCKYSSLQGIIILLQEQRHTSRSQSGLRILHYFSSRYVTRKVIYDITLLILERVYIMTVLIPERLYIIHNRFSPVQLLPFPVKVSLHVQK